MKIINLSKDTNIYTSNVYLILGDWNAIADVNTLIDAGRDPAIIEKINRASTGVGKHKVDQVFLTHSHYDHASLLPQLKKTFGAKAYAFSTSLAEIDQHLKGGEKVRIGDRTFEVFHTPGHSNDSICLYCEEEQLLFSGDTPVSIATSGGTHEECFVQALEMLCRKKVKTIYPGHGDPIQDGQTVLRRSLQNVRNGRVIPSRN